MANYALRVPESLFDYARMLSSWRATSCLEIVVGANSFAPVLGIDANHGD